MKPLFGEYDVTIDHRKRLLVPSEIRKALDPETDGQGFYLVTGVNGRLWLYPQKHYEMLASRTESQLAPDEDQLAFDQAYFSLACLVLWDRQGRILIPEKVIQNNGIERQVVFLGTRDHAEIWNRSDWQKRSEDLNRRRAQIAKKQAQKRKQKPVDGQA